jgi:hypothetical protein
MEPPQLRCAEAPMRASLRTPAQMVVDESVGNIRIQECQELGGASRRKQRVHGRADYSLKLYLSAKTGQQHILKITCLWKITYTETRNTLLNQSKPGCGGWRANGGDGRSSLHARVAAGRYAQRIRPPAGGNGPAPTDVEQFGDTNEMLGRSVNACIGKRTSVRILSAWLCFALYPFLYPVPMKSGPKQSKGVFRA